MQVGEIVLDLARSFDRIDVRAQLNEVTGDETGGKPEMPQGLNEQPRRVAAGSRARSEGLLRRLDARLHANDVSDLLLKLGVEVDQKIDRARRFARNTGQIRRQQRSGLSGCE